jgi:hypothetical protein
MLKSTNFVRPSYLEKKIMKISVQSAITIIKSKKPTNQAGSCLVHLQVSCPVMVIELQ